MSFLPLHIVRPTPLGKPRTKSLTKLVCLNTVSPAVVWFVCSGSSSAITGTVPTLPVYGRFWFGCEFGWIGCTVGALRLNLLRRWKATSRTGKRGGLSGVKYLACVTCRSIICFWAGGLAPRSFLTVLAEYRRLVGSGLWVSRNGRRGSSIRLC